jgi:hypothetical protein
MVTVAVVLGLAVIGTASAYGYRSYMGSPRSGTPPVFKADTTPTKVVPPTSQSADSGNKMFVDRVASADGQERVVPREEQPVDVNARSVFPTPRIGAAQPGAPAPGNANAAPLDEPRKIRTVRIGSDQPTAVPQTSAPAPRPVATQPVTGRPAAGQAPGTMASTSGGNVPMSLAPGGPVRSASASAPVETAPVNPTRGGFLVQIASQKTEAEAQTSYRSAQTRFPSLLGSSSPIIKRFEHPEKGVFYRALVGPFASQEEAAKLCSNLKSAGGDCVVQRN